MAKTNWSQRVFQKPGSFDVDMDDEYCGVIGGEIADWTTVGPAWDWRPDDGITHPEGSGNDARVLGSLNHSEFHTAREGTLMNGSYVASGHQTNPVERGTIEMFRGGPGDGDPVRRGSEDFGIVGGRGGPDPVRAGSRLHGGGAVGADGMSPAVRGTDPYGKRERGGQRDPVRSGDGTDGR